MLVVRLSRRRHDPSPPSLLSPPPPRWLPSHLSVLGCYLFYSTLAGTAVSAPQAACTFSRTSAAALPEDAEYSSAVVYRRVAPQLRCLGYQEMTAAAAADAAAGEWNDAPEIDCPEGLAFDILSCDCSADAPSAANLGPMCSYQTASGSVADFGLTLGLALGIALPFAVGLVAAIVVLRKRRLSGGGRVRHTTGHAAVARRAAAAVQPPLPLPPERLAEERAPDGEPLMVHSRHKA